MMLGALLLLIMAVPATAQVTIDPATWRVAAEDVNWLDAADNAARGASYNPATGNALVATRTGGARVVAVNGDTGATIGDLDMTGVAGGTFAINVVGASDDGQIFATNLVTAAAEATPFKIYRWASEGAAPTVVYEGAPTAARYGDSFFVYGSGDDVYLFASGSGTAAIAEFHWDGTALQAPRIIPVTAGAGRGGIAVGADGESLWITGSGTPVREVSRDTGALIREIDTGVIATGASLTAYFEVEDRQFVVTGISALEQFVRIVDVTAPGEEEIVAVTASIGTNANVNATGGLAVATDRAEIIVLSTNNALASFSYDFLLPEEPFIPEGLIAYWHQNDNELSGGGFGFEEGDFPQPADVGMGIITLDGGDVLATTEAGVYRWIQSFGGTELNRLNETVEAGGTLAIQGGTDAVNNGAYLQIEFSAVGYEDIELSYAVRGTNTGFRSHQISYSTDGETFLNFGDAFDPVDGSNFTVRTFNFGDALDHAETAWVRITLAGATGETGNNRFDNITLMGTPAEPPAPPIVLEEAVWAITPGQVPWLLPAGNTMRGGAYNLATDHVLVVSRAPGLAIHVLHPANGTSLGTMDVTGVAGGTFALSEIAVTDDGQIFGANLTLDGQSIRIYRWADQWAAPALVWEGNLNNRAGDAFSVGGFGNDVRLYISGTFNESVAILEWDGSAVGAPRYITPEATVDRARMGIAEVMDGDAIWINGPGTALALVSTEDGEILRQVSLDVLPSGFGDIAYFELDGRQYIVAGSAHQNDNIFKVVDITDEGAERIAYTTEPLGIYENTFFTGFTAFDSKRSNIVVGGTNAIVAAFSLADHDNAPPMAAEITSPADGAEVRIEGDGSTEFTATWTEATDPDGDTVLYRWQLSSTADFESPIVDASVGTATSFTTDFATVAAILDDAGIVLDGELTVYHRVITSDGAVETEGEAKTVTLVRGTLTNVEPGVGLPQEFALHGNYPNPFNPTTNIRFDLPQTADVRVEVYDVLGRQVMSLHHDGMMAGANQTIAVDAGRLASGTYLYRVVVEMQGVTRVETGKMLLVK
jgi:hypothetical protein